MGSPIAWEHQRQIGVAGFCMPWLTVGLLASFIAVFVLEQRFAVVSAGPAQNPTVVTLVALGGLSRALATSGEWYRLLTAPFLHASLKHLTANGIAFALSGYALERLVGRAWLFCIFALGALAGSAGSLTLSPPTTVSVGASGAIMAMLTALFMISFRLPIGKVKTNIQVHSARIAIPALFPISNTTMHIDYGAHTGGAVFGVVIGFLLLGSWQDDSPLPDLRAGATALAAAAALSFGLGGYAVTQRYASYATPTTMIPAAEYPHGAAAIASTVDRLLAAYPQDPRAHFLAAGVRLARGDKAEAEQQFKAALALTEASPDLFRPSLATTIRVGLAATMLEEGRQPEARLIAHAACTAKGDTTPEPTFAQLLARSGLCDTGAVAH
jgi:rhomboid protease GluP